MFSSATVNWSTPQKFFDQYNQKYHFTLDVCALPENAKCPVYFTPDDDGLKQTWEGVAWMNPPYGREIPKWIEKAFQEANCTKTTVVSLLPARVDTRWFHCSTPHKHRQWLSSIFESLKPLKHEKHPQKIHSQV